ncbi:MAG: domain containing protein [Ferruginibacter sp.]|nr:domain containing protein [Ferruginibacter sp.]
MMKKGTIFLLIGLLLCTANYAQVCTALGQNPSTAFPVCGTTTFTQNTVPICSSAKLFVPGCSGSSTADYENKNPFWYKFTCYQAGTLSFRITPNNLGDDYDWQLYDITGRDPDAVYSDGSLVVTGNWSGSYGVTGASSSGVNFLQCASDPAANLSTFAKSPQLILGHEYLLLVSHFTNSQSGYALSFAGGTAVITDPTLPHIASAVATCDAMQVRVKLNKNMKCSSLNAAGLEFSLSPASATVTAASSAKCSNSFDMDLVVLTLSNPLPPGNYTVAISNGPDGNTLLDNCDRSIPQNESASFSILPLLPTPMDSLTKIKCAPQVLELVFKKPIKCSTIEPGGSDFTVSGPVPVTVSGASGNCVDGFTDRIFVQLTAPLQTGGTYAIHLQTGTDGNTIFDECGQESLNGAQISFVVKDTVNANFTYAITYGCQKNVVQYNHDGRNGINSWTWDFGNGIRNSSQNPMISYTNFEQKNTQLIVSNGLCSDTAAVSIFFDNLLNADFEINAIVCPNDLASIKNKTVGNVITAWDWNLGNGSTSQLKDPAAQSYPYRNTTYNQAVQLIVRNNYGCQDTAVRIIKVINNCFIAVPSAFTPNGDGLNDYLYPLNAYKALDLTFSVYNRFGQQVFTTRDWTIKWDGRFKGQGADAGTYVWLLRYTNADTGNKVEQKGSSILIR